MDTPMRSGSLHLRAWRESRKLTLEHVGNKLGVLHSTVQRWETANVMLQPATIRALAAIYECTPAELAFLPEHRERGQLMHRLLTAFGKLDDRDAEAAVGIVERMPSARD